MQAALRRILNDAATARRERCTGGAHSAGDDPDLGRDDLAA